MLSEYVDAVRTLAKATGNTVSPKSIKSITRILDAHEPAVYKAVQAALVKARKRFVKRFQVHAVILRFESLGKSVSDDVQNYIRNIIAATYGSEFVDDIMTALEPAIEDVITQVSEDYGVSVNFDLVNSKAVEYLRDKAENTFSQLMDDQAKGIYAKIADSISEKYTIADVAESIRSEYISKNLISKTSSGVRELDSSNWSFMVARTETARAASFAQKATLQEIGMKTWQWNVQDSGCDICDDNDDAIVAIGDDFPSGDSEPPAHPNCRCVVTAVLDELTSDDNEEQ